MSTLSTSNIRFKKPWDKSLNQPVLNDLPNATLTQTLFQSISMFNLGRCTSVHIGAQCMGSKHAWNAGILAGVWNLSKGSCRVAMVVQCKIWHPLDPKDGCPCAKCAKCALCKCAKCPCAFVYKKSILQISHSHHSHDSHVTKVHPAWRPGATDRSLNMLNLPIFQGTKSDTFEASRCGDVVCGLFPHGNSLATT